MSRGGVRLARAGSLSSVALPRLPVWLVIPHVLAQLSSAARVGDDRLFLPDLVSYVEAEHLLRALCSMRWFHNCGSGGGVHLDPADGYLLPPVLPSVSHAPSGDGDSEDAPDALEEMKGCIADALAATLALLSAQCHSHASLVRTHQLIREFVCRS